VVYVPELDRIFVANGGDGSVNTYDGESYAKVGSVAFGDDADNLRYDASAKRVYVGYGSGAIGAIDVTSLQRKSHVKLKGHPESFQLEKIGTKIYVNVPAAKEIAIIDRSTMSLLSSWSLDRFSANFPMSLDEKGRRLFIGTRQPPRILVQDIVSGKPIVELPIAGDTDDLFYDAPRKQLYVSCGEGVLRVFREEAQKQFKELSQLTTVRGARTCLMDSQRRTAFSGCPSRQLK
jgi:DNA-binding beta-propeller fold protein YncE